MAIFIGLNLYMVRHCPIPDLTIGTFDFFFADIFLILYSDAVVVLHNDESIILAVAMGTLIMMMEYLPVLSNCYWSNREE